MQDKVREQHGAQVTAFDQVVDGERMLCKGDAVHMATKPIFAGRALRFLVGQASLCDISCLVSGLLVQLPVAGLVTGLASMDCAYLLLVVPHIQV